MPVLMAGKNMVEFNPIYFAIKQFTIQMTASTSIEDLELQLKVQTRLSGGCVKLTVCQSLFFSCPSAPCPPHSCSSPRMAAEPSSLVLHDRRRSFKTLLQLPLLSRNPGFPHLPSAIRSPCGPHVLLPEDVLRHVQ